jgi:hypothetical protein
MTTIKKMTALNAVTANTTSNKFFVGGAKRVGVLVRRADHSSGSSAFTIKGSLDYDDVTPVMTALNVWIDNVTNTNSQTLTRVNGKTLAANGDAMLWLDTNCFVNWLEITVAETTDGTHSAWILAEYEA